MKKVGIFLGLLLGCVAFVRLISSKKRKGPWFN